MCIRDRHCSAHHHYSQAQIGEQGDSLVVGFDTEVFQDLSKEAQLLLAEDLVVFLRKMFKDMLLFLDGQPVSYTHLDVYKRQ